jgi:hypothetical protein
MEEDRMKRLVLAALLIAPVAACGPTYVNETRPGYAYGTPTYVQPGYVQPQPYAYSQQPQVVTPMGGYRDGSYEAERQAYEYGRRDGAVGR